MKTKLFDFLKKFKLSQKGQKNAPISGQSVEISKTRCITTPQTRFIKRAERTLSGATPMVQAQTCPYCSSRDTVKKGYRQKKYESQQRYLCNACSRTFVAPKAKGKSFPLKVILDGISYYNTGFTLAESCKFLKEKSGIDVKETSLANWVKEYEDLCRYSRMRPYGLKLYSPNQVIQTVTLYHRQVYEFSYHRSKMALILQDFKHSRFENLREYLEAIQTECPHQFFQEGIRASELKVDFRLDEVIIREKQNFATRITDLALQAVNDNKLRHKAIQRFMLCNDSVTVATEVPVYIDDMDIEHMNEALGFKIPIKLDKVLTGHIDILQVRNGAVHILDYKPQIPKKSRPINQLTLYALALSRLTGLRLYDFKCAWFDETNYWEFFPLHVVYKLRDRARKESPEQLKFTEFDTGSQSGESEV